MPVEALADTSTSRFLTFCIGAQLYALRAEEVVEVMRVPVMARVPQAPAALSGIANLRGTVLPVVSLRELLGQPPLDRKNAGNARAIVLDGAAPVALIVDSVQTLETATSQQIDAAANTVAASDAEKLLGVFTTAQQNSAAKILDIQALLASAFANRARARRQATTTAVQAEKRDSDNDVAEIEVLVSFDVAGQEYALTLDAVQEILPLPESMTAVARAEAVVLGVISVREALLPLLSLRALLGFPARQREAEGREKIIVMRLAGALVGLVADRARTIVRADAASIDPMPPVLAARTGGEARVRAIYRGEAGRRLISILSPERLFREDVMQKLLAEHNEGEGNAAPGEAANAAEQIFLVFRLGGDEFGLPIHTVVEVAQVPPQITRVPRTPKFLEGVVNLRGEVLPVVDQRRRFDMPKLEAMEGRRLVVIQTERHRAGLIVDGVADVLRVAADAIEPPPDLTDATTRLVRGVINLEQSQRLVLVLDPAEVLTRAEQGLLDTFKALGKKSGA